MLKTLCERIGVSGYEKPVVDYLFHELEKIPYGEAYIDKVGNLIFHVKGSAQRKVLVQAHIDEVGFQVLSELDKGEFSLKSLGNIKTWNAYQQRVISNNGIRGVIYAKDPEQLKAYNYDNLVLRTDISDTSEKVLPGDVFAFDSIFIEGDQYYTAKALDNRVSCYCLLETIAKCKALKNDTYFCFSVLEETNMRGSRVAKSTIKPDVCITVDVSCVGARNSLKLKKGVGIKISDSMGISTSECVSRAVNLACENEIDYQMEVSDCGTSEMVISNELDNGHEELGISIPCNYLHSANTLVYKNDVVACLAFLPILTETI